MPDRTLAEAIADIRVSDRKFAADFTTLRLRLLGALGQLEKDAQITFGFRLDEDQVAGEFAKLEQYAQDFAPVTKLRIDADAALADLAALTGLADPLVVKVVTDGGIGDVADLSNLVIPPVVVTANVDQAIAAITSIPDAAPDVVVPVAANTDPAVEHLAGFQANLDAIHAMFRVDANTDPAVAAITHIPDVIPAVVIPVNANLDPAMEHLPGFQANLDSIHAMFHVDADPTQAEAAIDEVGDAAESRLPDSFERAGEESGSRFAAGVKKTAGAIASTIGIALGGFIAGALVTGFERLNTIEDATASLTVQLGSASDAAKLLDEVLAVVRGTPFNLDQFAKAAANMVSFGIETQKIPVYLRAIGEAAASQGGRANEVSQRLSLIFGQISTANRIGGQELLQFSEAGVNALAILGNHYGKTTAEIRDMVSRGLVPAKEALDVLSEDIMNGSKGIAGTTVAFSGTMAKLRETLTGSIGGFKAATARFGVELIEPFKDGLVAAFNGATAVIDGFAKKVSKALSGIGDSGIGKDIIEELKNLPALVDRVSEGLSKIGPAVAPLAGFLGASGLGAIKGVLGDFGKFIPGLSPITAAIAAFVVFTPQIRDELFPVLVKLVKIVGEAGAVVTVAAGKISESLVPVFVKLAQVANGLVPMVENVLKFGEGLLAIVVPAIGLFAAAIEHIPVGVIVALVTAFGAFKLLSHDFEFLEKAAWRTGKVLEKFGVDSEEAAGKGVKAMHALEIGIGAAFAGMALTSSDGATQITGAVGSIAAIGTGLATGGPWGGAAAAAGVGIGLITGLFINQAREAAALKAEINNLAKSYTDQTLELIKDNEALTKWLELSSTTRGSATLGEIFLNDTEQGKKYAAMMTTLGLASQGLAGDTAFGGLIKVLGTVKGDITQTPVLMGRLTDMFDTNATLVAEVVSKYAAAGRGWDSLQADLGAAKNNTPINEGLGVTREELVTISDMLGPSGELRGRFDTTFTSLFDIVKLATGDEGLKALRLSMEQTAVASPAWAAATDLITAADKGRLTATLNLEDALTRRDQIEQLLAGNSIKVGETMISAYDVRMKRITTALKGAEVEHLKFEEAFVGTDKAISKSSEAVTDEMIAGWQKLADQLHLDILDVLPSSLDDIVKELRDTDASGADVIDTLKGLPAPLSAAEQAAKNLADAVLLSKGAAEAVSAEIDRMQSKLSDTSAAQNFEAALRGVTENLNTITNEADIKQGEQLDKSIADQRDKIAKLTTDVQREFDSADVKRRSLADQLEMARKLGDANGIALIEAELQHVDDKAREKQGELDKAFAALDEFDARMAKLNLVPTSILKTLTDQAGEKGMSIFDFLLKAPTAEARTEWQSQLTPLFGDANKEFVKAATADPANATAIAKSFRDQLLVALTDKGFDPATATALVDYAFDTTKLTPDIQRAAAATKLQYAAELRKAFEDDGSLGVLAKAVMSAPLQSDAGRLQAAAARDQLQAEFDKHNLEIGVTPRTLTDADVAALSGFVVEAIVPLKAIDVTSAAVALTTQDVTLTYSGALTNKTTTPTTTARLVQNSKTGVYEREGGIIAEDHMARIVAAGAFRVFAEPETHGEGYIPLSPFKRTRSTQIMAEIADLFGYQLEPKAKAKMVLPAAFGGGGGGVPADADAIGRAVARHTAPLTAARLADGYDHAVHVEPGAIVIQGDRGPKRTAVRLVSELAELALRRR